jgi:hypothetical protein
MTYEAGLEENCNADTLLERFKRSLEFSFATKLTCFRSTCCSFVAVSNFLRRIKVTTANLEATTYLFFSLSIASSASKCFAYSSI